MKSKVDENSDELAEMKRFSRRIALQVLGGAGFGMFLTVLANPVSIAGQTKEKNLVVDSPQNTKITSPSPFGKTRKLY